MTRTNTLYRQLADTLRTAISTGQFATGDQLPTELELCATHNVSRHTARDALRLLTDEGLIERKRGVGTRVKADQPTGPFSQEWGDIGDILQYARDTRLLVRNYGHASAHHVTMFGLDSVKQWMVVEGDRRRLEGGPILAWTTICVRADLMPPRSALEEWSQAIGEYIALHNHVQATHIEQEISAITLSKVQAKALHEHVGDPALCTLRRYHSGQAGVFLASMSVHPGDRFVYRMRIAR
jgi:GntR family transcriptional regulator